MSETTVMIEKARRASFSLQSISADEMADILRDIADELVKHSAAILEANRLDLSKMDQSNPMYDRLKLTPERIEAIASDMRNVASLPSPVGRVLDERTLDNGLHIRKISVPFGVIGVIFEARPNVSCDVASLCLRSGNACVLKGGHDAACSNQALVDVIRRVLRRRNVDENAVTLLPPTREATAEMLEARGLVDLVIPRGSSGLIKFVRENARIPVIETGAGVCHVYMHASADVGMTSGIVCNAKTRRVSVCNALDCFLIDVSRVDNLPEIAWPLARKGVKMYADPRAMKALRGYYPNELLLEATTESFGTEFLSLTMAIHVVDGIDEAIEHIRRYGSGHSESIVTEDEEAAAMFCQQVDAACVYVNAPTSWTDGAQFGLGAEIGISTQKLHARGPMALRELTTYKWVIIGHGQLRP
ncbi:MAG: glutamate-5-semialdehyde dehydrogenase [Bacteroides sp.]|nr:glutamate-5-semialdehyde dehydrogenase [Bacteroides sp.]MCM1413721.1 glutamate-5-semialdehyde dehydrogenase [Bacteroides sp.]MCM1471900.1 glutamate-5-semialdehyde dehydrogenase [Bacteroides sp.]